MKNSDLDITETTKEEAMFILHFGIKKLLSPYPVK